MSEDNMVCLPPGEFEKLLKQQAKLGAKEALAEVGLDYEGASDDVSDLKDLIQSWRSMKKEVFKTFARYMTTFLLGILTIGVAVKIGLIKILGH